jgi:hypothetical protein
MGPRIKDLEKSGVIGSILVTDASRTPFYLPPDSEGRVLTIVNSGGNLIPVWADSPALSEYEVYALFSGFPPTGDGDVIYYAKDTGFFYIWDGLVYVAVPGVGAFTITGAADSGVSQAIANGQTFTLHGVNGFTVVASAGRNFTLTPPVGSASTQFMHWNNATSEWEALDIPASLIVNTPAGNITALTGQAAINQLDTEKNKNIQFKNGGANLGSAGTVNELDVTGDATAVRVGDKVTINVNASGETNTASNVNAGGIGVFKQKTGTDLEFKGINAGNIGITVAADVPNNEIDISLNVSTGSGNVLSLDGSGILAKQVVEYFTPANASNTIALANTPRPGTLVQVKINSVVAIVTTDWSIVANVITVVVPFANSSGGTGLSSVEVIYWL